jgi:hypothetical protein
MLIVMLQLPVVDSFASLPLAYRKQSVNDRIFVSSLLRQKPKSLIYMNNDGYLSNLNKNEDKLSKKITYDTGYQTKENKLLLDDLQED